MQKIEFFKHNIDEEDISRVTSVLKSIFLTNANVTKEFEEKFATYLDATHCVAVSSCTAALHLSLLALGIKDGDEVITTPMSFVATSNAILHAGAIPVFVDIEESTGNIDFTLIEAAITPKTKAIMPVHLYGNMCDMKAIKKIANKHKLKIIEDAAHCIEGERDGVRVGELGDVACFSFYATKNITSGEGGAITTNNDEVAKLLYQLRLHGINKDASSRYTDKFAHWDMKVLGWKYNISDIQSALLIGQLEKIEDRLSKREEIARYYEVALNKLGVEYIKVPENTKSARHLFIIKIKNRDKVVSKLQSNGIGVAVNYRAIHILNYYKNSFSFQDSDFPIAKKFGDEVLSLPLYTKLELSQLAYIISNLAKI
ncbi:DegT/DnrJ/EryC1/StrS family aminotransferase [Sulfurimonas sp.]|uniref:DegT/DnrJ/EryC1/StrS family aminotransferase n=1 Tax=Sulfurimonas sp. TaxID=2022749 RepID=UPI002B490D5C|nr:DegT/DnrJ/EryC1/StrS family aminotransferase [Sulfurimonas sp.]